MTKFEELIARKNKGSLKVYLGYAAGVGKTFEMLQEGHRLKQQGIDVVIGYVEPHARPETSALLEGLEQVSKKNFWVENQCFSELDVAGVLKRRPQIVLIDEMAHANAAGSKNERRFQDIFDVLDQGINVVTNLNVQHLESAASMVTEATSVPVLDRLPDQILRRADQIVLVDVGMDELRERVRSGKIFEKSRAEIALQRFFTYENLSFLREVCLREVAGDQFRKIEQQELLNKDVADLAQEGVMVALSSDPTHASILLRKASRLAARLSTRCYAVYIQKKVESAAKIDPNLQKKLQNNLKLAKTLGAEVVTLQAENISEALVTFATTHHVKHAVFGKPRRSPMMELLRGSILLSFIHDSVGVDVHIVTTTGEIERDEALENTHSRYMRT